MGAAVTGLTATQLQRAEREQSDLQLSNVADGFAAVLQMHLAGCEAGLRSASMVASADAGLDAMRWLRVGQQAHVGDFNACAESMVYLDAPPGTSRERRVFTAPASADAQDFVGFDPWNDPVHRTAMEKARDDDKPQLTALATWPGIVAQTAADARLVVWYMPVYRPDAVLDSAVTRTAALSGFVAIPIRVDGIVEMLGQQFPNAELALDYVPDASSVFAGTMTLGPPGTARTGERLLRIGGRWWTLRAGLAAPTDGLLRLSASTIAFVTGLLLSLVLAGLTRSMLAQAARAYALARRFSADARDGEARLRSVLDGTGDGIFTVDLEGHLLSANRAAREVLGYEDAELLGRHYDVFLRTERVATYHAAWSAFIAEARASEDRYAPTQEIALLHRDGHAVRVRSSLYLVRGDGREFVVWVISDLTRELEAERRAQEVAALNQAILDVTPFGVLTIGADRTIASANRASHSMHGYRPGELVGQPADILVDSNELEARTIQLGVRVNEVDHRDDEADASGVSPLARHSTASGDAVCAVEALTETEWTSVRKDGSRFPAGVIALPLRDAQGRSLGGLRMVMDITERKRAAARIEHMALHDSLTGLPNRVLLHDRAEQTMARARRDATGFAFVLLDPPRSTPFNHPRGHPRGAEALTRGARRISDAMRSSDTVVRMGGDEFALLLPDVCEAQQAIEVGHKILGALADAFAIEGHLLHVTSSIGVALYPTHAEDLETLLRHADAAMYDAKSRGRDRVALYDPQMTALASGRLILEADLRRALGTDEFVLHYQPLVASADGRVLALEALVRWNHPQRGLVPPLDFIPIAEETGLIVPIGAWVLRRACADLARLRCEGHASLRVAVNISPRQFLSETLEDTVAAALAENGLPGSALELEITESVLMTSIERTNRTLGRLHALGVDVAVDDFGIGYSSLSYLANFSVQSLKIDRSFVQQIDAKEGKSSLVKAIVAMAHSLGLSVVAEGVETSNQHRHLADLGCELLQGFRFSRAVPFESLPDVITGVEAMAGPRVGPLREIAGRVLAA